VAEATNCQGTAGEDSLAAKWTRSNSVLAGMACTTTSERADAAGIRPGACSPRRYGAFPINLTRLATSEWRVFQEQPGRAHVLDGDNRILA
jgi:hypothetical protein